MTDEPSLVCPCGAPAPGNLPPRGTVPARCPSCATPLVAPGPPPAAAFERGLWASMIVAVAAAAGWALLCHATRTGAPWTLAVAGIAVGATARAAARARGGRVQLAAGLALLVFFALGEFLIYRHALLPRLEAMHRAEGAQDSEIRAEEELEQIRRDPERYAAIEATRDLFLAMAAGIAAALWITRPRAAVAAFHPPSPVAEGSPPGVRGYGGQAPVSGPSSEPSSSAEPSPEPSTPSAPASPGSDPPSAGSPDGS